MRILDLFCGAGGAAVGYHRAGFEVVGVDIAPQPRYPFEFHQADAMTYPLDGFDVIHASPPCQAHIKGLRAANEALGRDYAHPDLVLQAVAKLAASGMPYVVENVEGAPLVDATRICGTGLGMPLRRHRLFMSNAALIGVPCAHGQYRDPRYWTSWRPDGERRKATTVQVYGNGAAGEWPDAMGIDWMTSGELVEAIPPAYTEHIGRQLIEQIGRAAA